MPPPPSLQQSTGPDRHPAWLFWQGLLGCKLYCQFQLRLCSICTQATVITVHTTHGISALYTFTRTKEILRIEGRRFWNYIYLFAYLFYSYNWRFLYTDETIYTVTNAQKHSHSSTPLPQIPLSGTHTEPDYDNFWLLLWLLVISYSPVTERNPNGS